MKPVSFLSDIDGLRLNPMGSCKNPAISDRAAYDFRKCMVICRSEQCHATYPLDSVRQPKQILDVLNSMLGKLHDRNCELNTILRNVRSGTVIQESEILALQGRMLNFAQEVMTVSKIVESAMNTIKTTLHIQV